MLEITLHFLRSCTPSCELKRTLLFTSLENADFSELTEMFIGDVGFEPTMADPALGLMETLLLSILDGTMCPLSPMPIRLIPVSRYARESFSRG